MAYKTKKPKKTKKNSYETPIEKLKTDFEKEIGKIENIETERQFGVTTWRIETEDGEEYLVTQNENQAYELAVDRVREDLEYQPELFNKSFIEQHFDTEWFIEEVRTDIYNMAYEDVAQEYEEYGLTEKDIEEYSDKYEKKVEELAEERLDDIRNDPVDYLEGLGMEDKIYDYINVEEASKDAVNVDGFAHFLATYDGDCETTKSGFVIMRTN